MVYNVINIEEDALIQEQEAEQEKSMTLEEAYEILADYVNESTAADKYYKSKEIAKTVAEPIYSKTPTPILKNGFQKSMKQLHSGAYDKGLDAGLKAGKFISKKLNKDISDEELNSILKHSRAFADRNMHQTVAAMGKELNKRGINTKELADKYSKKGEAIADRNAKVAQAVKTIKDKSVSAGKGVADAGSKIVGNASEKYKDIVDALKERKPVNASADMVAEACRTILESLEQEEYYTIEEACEILMELNTDANLAPTGMAAKGCGRGEKTQAQYDKKLLTYLYNQYGNKVPKSEIEAMAAKMTKNNK